MRMLLVLLFSLGVHKLTAQDIVIYGGTPGGIACAISAARMGHQVILIEPHHHVGGMTASGLGKSDIENRSMIGGIFNEFVNGVLNHYVHTYGADHENTRLCHDGYYAEPHVAERVFEQLLGKEESLAVWKGWKLVAGKRMTVD